ncbi:MAG: hypothetical protein ABI907_04060 [Ramlibacter sp.]
MIVVKTEAGHRVMKDRSVPLTPRQRSAFILFDGKRTIEQVLTATAVMGVIQEDIDHMIGLGLLADAQPEVTAAHDAQVEAVADAVKQHKERTPQQRYAEAYLIATQLTAGLGLRGFRLNLAVEAVGNFEQLLELAPRIREAVGPEKYAALDNALNDR